MFLYANTHTHTHTYIYIYIYIDRERESDLISLFEISCPVNILSRFETRGLSEKKSIICCFIAFILISLCWILIVNKRFRRKWQFGMLRNLMVGPAISLPTSWRGLEFSGCILCREVPNIAPKW